MIAIGCYALRFGKTCRNLRSCDTVIGWVVNVFNIHRQDRLKAVPCKSRRGGTYRLFGRDTINITSVSRTFITSNKTRRIVHTSIVLCYLCGILVVHWGCNRKKISIVRGSRVWRVRLNLLLEIVGDLRQSYPNPILRAK